MATPLSVSALWRETRSVAEQNFGTLVTIAAAFVLLPNLLAMVLAPDAFSMGAVQGRSPDRALRAVGSAILLVAGQFYGQAVIIDLVTDPARPTVAEVLRRIARRLPDLLLLLLLMIGIGLVVGFVVAAVLVLPAMLIGQKGMAVALANAVAFLVLTYGVLRLAPVLSVLVAEQASAIESVRRSWRLTRGRLLPMAATVGAWLLFLLLALSLTSLIAGVVTRALGVLLDAERLMLLLNAFASGIVVTVLFVYFSVLTAVLWRHLRAAN